MGTSIVWLLSLVELTILFAAVSAAVSVSTQPESLLVPDPWIHRTRDDSHNAILNWYAKEERMT